MPSLMLFILLGSLALLWFTLAEYLGRRSHRRHREHFRRIHELGLEIVRQERARIAAQETRTVVEMERVREMAKERGKSKKPREPEKSRWEMLKDD